MILTIGKDSLKPEGYGNPVATLQTAVCAGLSGDQEAFFECFTPEVSASFRALETDRQTCSADHGGCGCGENDQKITGLRVWAQRALSDEEVQLEYELVLDGEHANRCKQVFRRIGSDWKISGPPELI